MIASSQLVSRAPIAGWLLYYCISRGLFEPAYFIYSFAKLLNPAERILEVCISLSGFAAILLIYRRNPLAARPIAIDLVCRFLFGLVVFIRLLNRPPQSGHTPAVHLASAIVIAGIGWAFALFWFLYLRTSRRVREVFGKNLFHSAR